MSITTRALPFDRPDPIEPPPTFAELRDTTPVAPVTTPDGQPAWLVTSYDAVATVLSDPRFGMAPPGAVAGNDTLFQDGEAHARLRRLVGKAFTARSVAALRSRIEQLAADHVEVIADSGPSADLVAGLAAPLSISVISELLGVAIDEREHFRELADAVNAADPFAFDGAEDTAATAMQPWNDLGGYVAGLVAAKREELGEDLLSGLIAVRDTDDGRLSDDELIAMAAMLVDAGYLTACNAISVGTIRLITEGRLGTLASDPDKVEATVEEVLRMQAGLTGEPFPRWAHDDFELAGVPIAAGDMVFVRLEAANRDPEQFADPDFFLPDRGSAAHLAFGRGPHHCLGAALARVEVGAALSALAQRLPGLRLQGPVADIVWTRSHTDAGPAALHVTW